MAPVVCLFLRHYLSKRLTLLGLPGILTSLLLGPKPALLLTCVPAARTVPALASSSCLFSSCSRSETLQLLPPGGFPARCRPQDVPEGAPVRSWDSDWDRRTGRGVPICPTCDENFTLVLILGRLVCLDTSLTSIKSVKISLRYAFKSNDIYFP